MQRRLIVTHAQRNVQELPHAGDVNIYLCVTTFKRTYQLKECLPQNVLLTWPYRSRVRWVVLDLNDGQEQEEVRTFIQDNFVVPIVAGHLVYFRAPQPYWHASWAKNASHSAAMTLMGDDNAVLVNCDNDNLLTRQFIDMLVEHAPKLIVDPCSTGCLAMLRFSGADGGVTGRMALSARMFRMLGGYDQTFWPMGHQDIDLAKRATKLGTVKLVAGTDLAGESVPNLPRGFPGGRSNKSQIQAKVANVAPEFRGVTWPEMNTRNRDLAKKAVREPRRNLQYQSLGYCNCVRVVPCAVTLDWSQCGVPAPPAWPPTH